MVLGPCTCITTSCENTASVSGCSGSQTQANLFCDGDVFYYDASSFVYDQGGTYCNVQGGSTTLECSCSAASSTSSASYSSPNTNGAGFSTDASAYDNTMPDGPCQCDLSLTSSDGSITYASIGNSNRAVYCDGGGDIFSVPNTTLSEQSAGALYIECGTAYANANAPSQYRLQGLTKNCRCVASTAAYYQVGPIGTTPVAVPTPIASRVSSLQAGSASGGTAEGTSSAAHARQAAVGECWASSMLFGLVMIWMVSNPS
ncbi:hypothetical protein I316_05869 [Kwoniella heveanensis BCC8398]|uniref:Uncharacterized protein n=1 Tax=Kwoniella heveanensis BCC8398 TaxID=1296120 RepID=A0A1B9GN88_9TREE|nr:hypothetical protein I316_05869 [Kwoniella heveanensis BCC8398]